METIAFYSYKGGVGRSLLLANAARFLATLGKGVVALDFDFEAPGLHYKLGAENIISRRSTSLGGAVPYLVATADGASSPPPLDKHIVSLAVPPGEGWLTLMPAGPAPHVKYWSALKELGEKLHLGDSSGRGVMALLDLEGRIADELKPDYLLIDARTGITELGGLATTILADTVVCMFAANQESLDGTVTVVEALKAAPRPKKKRPIRVVPVLSRASQPPSDERFANGMKRLLELAAPRRTAKSKEAAKPTQPQRKSEAKQGLFALPHDDAMAVSERVVGGDQKASAFSPLYKAYLELFESLFPARAEPARRVLERLEAVNTVKKDLTKADGHEEYESSLSPWSDSAIQEGVVYEAEGYAKKGSRYADLVCRDDSGSAVMVVEYIAEGSEEEAVEFWEKSSKVRCVLLMWRTQTDHTSYLSRNLSRAIYTRPANGSELHKAHRQWELPRPREFELLSDVGDQSVDSMLEAVRRGQADAVPWLINEWIDSLPSGGIKGRGRSRPERARRILDGLAATEDVQCADDILRRASPGVYGHSRRHHRMRHDFDFPQDVDGQMAAELYAPLFWRLPVEAAIQSMDPERRPFGIPPLAGYGLLAQRLMGLLYDPFQNSLDEARAFAARVGRLSEHDDDDDFADHLLHRGRRDFSRNVVLSAEPPPILVWEEVLREEPFFRGTLVEAYEKVASKGKESLVDRRHLRSPLRAKKERNDLATHGLLGSYDPSGRVNLYVPVIDAAAEVLGMSPRHLKSVVFMQLSAWALAHQARDLDSQPGYGFAPSPWAPFNHESPAHVSLIQAFTDRLIRRLQDPHLLAAFEKLSEHQPKAYRRWSAMRTLPLEELRVLLLRARASATALGLPDVIDAE